MKKVVSENLKKIGAGIPIFFAINIGIKFLVYLPIDDLCDNFWVELLFFFLSSFILRYLIILIYDHIKKDIGLIQYFKDMRHQKKEIEEHTYATRQIIKSEKSGKKYLLIIGIVCFDPIVTVLFFREGYYKWNNIPDKRTFLLFLASITFGAVTLTPIYYLFGGSVIRLLTWLFNFIF